MMVKITGHLSSASGRPRVAAGSQLLVPQSQRAFSLELLPGTLLLLSEAATCQPASDIPGRLNAKF